MDLSGVVSCGFILDSVFFAFAGHVHVNYVEYIIIYIYILSLIIYITITKIESNI